MSEKNKQTGAIPIIGISGKQFAGKDALAAILLAELEAAGRTGFKKCSLAAAIKEAYGKQHNLTLAEIEENKPKHRPGLIALGDWGRSKDPNYWLNQVLNNTEDAKGLIIPDVRMKNEFEVLDQQGAFLIRLEASREVRASRGQLVSESDPTECELDAQEGWDLLLQNNERIEVLQNTVHTVLEATQCFGLKPTVLV